MKKIFKCNILNENLILKEMMSFGHASENLILTEYIDLILKIPSQIAIISFKTIVKKNF